MSAATEPRSPSSLAGIPLLSFEELPPELSVRLRARVERLGYLGDFFRLTAHQPAQLAAFIDLTDASQAALPDDLMQLVALTVATRLGSDYERHQHEQLALRLGFGHDWVRNVEQLDPGSAELTDEQRAAQGWILDALDDHGRGAQGALRELVGVVGATSAVAVMLACGRYVAHALVTNSCGVRPPVPSIFATETGSR